MSASSADPDWDIALALTLSAAPAERVRGLTLLSASTNRNALDVALSLANDPHAAVQREAALVIAEHPLTDAATRAHFAQQLDDAEDAEDDNEPE